MILRPELTINEYETYLQYELQLDKLREIRTKKLITEDTPNEEISQLRVIRSSFIQHINYIYQRALRRFPNALHLWQSQMSFLQEKESYRFLDVALGKAIALFPKNVEFWLKAASIEIEVKQNFHAARIFVQRGLRVNPRHPQLWSKYFDIELWNIMRMLERRKILTAAKSLKEVEDEEWRAKLEKPLPIVLRHASRALFTSPFNPTSSTSSSQLPESELVEDEETEEVMVLLEESQVPSEHFQVIFHMHYLTLELSHLIANYSIADEMEEYLLSNYMNYKEVWRHLLRSRIMRSLQNDVFALLTLPPTTSPLEVEEELEAKGKKSSRSKKAKTADAAEEKDVIEEAIISLLTAHDTVFALYESKVSKNVLEGLECDLRDMSVQVITSLLSGISDIEEKAKASVVLGLVREVQTINPLQLPVTTDTLLHSTQIFLQHQLKDTTNICKRLRSTMRSRNDPITDFNTLVAFSSSLKVQQSLSEVISGSRLWLLLQILGDVSSNKQNNTHTRGGKKKEVVEEEGFSIEQILSFLTQLLTQLQVLVQRVEKGVAVEWKKSLKQPFFQTTLNLIATTLSLLSEHHSLFSDAWESFLDTNRQHMQSLAVLFAMKSETLVQCREVLSWYDVSALTSQLEAKNEDSGNEEDSSNEKVETWAMTWVGRTMSKVLTNVHIISNEVREEALLLYLDLFFAKLKDVVAWTEGELSNVSSFFFHHWQVFEDFPQLFPTATVVQFLKSFVTSLVDLMQEKDDKSVLTSSTSNLRRKRKDVTSSLSSGDEVVLKVLRKVSEYWTMLIATSKTEEENPFQPQLKLLLQYSSNAHTTVRKISPSHSLPTNNKKQRVV